MTDVVLAVDVGGTTITAGTMTADGEVLSSAEVATPHTDRGRDPGLTQVSDIIDRLRRAAAARAETVRAVSVGVPEYVHRDRVTSREVIAWERQPAEMLCDGSEPVPVFVESDVRCAAFAESRLAAAGEHDIFYVSWGTGISSTLVVDGVCRTGRRGEAIALGEFDVAAAVDPTWTANLEAFASGAGIAQRYAANHPGGAIDAREVAIRAERGDVDAGEIIRSAGRAVAAALRSCIAILDPDIVVLGGGIGSADGLLVHQLRTEVHRLHTRPDPPPIVPARLGTKAGLFGAGLLGWQRLPAGGSSPIPGTTRHA